MHQISISIKVTLHEKCIQFLPAVSIKRGCGKFAPSSGMAAAVSSDSHQLHWITKGPQLPADEKCHECPEEVLRH